MTRETVIWALEPGETNTAYEGVIYGRGQFLSDHEIADIVARATADGFHSFRASHWYPATNIWEPVIRRAAR